MKCQTLLDSLSHLSRGGRRSRTPQQRAQPGRCRPRRRQMSCGASWRGRRRPGRGCASSCRPLARLVRMGAACGHSCRTSVAPQSSCRPSCRLLGRTPRRQRPPERLTPSRSAPRGPRAARACQPHRRTLAAGPADCKGSLRRGGKRAAERIRRPCHALSGDQRQAPPACAHVSDDWRVQTAAVKEMLRTEAADKLRAQEHAAQLAASAARWESNAKRAAAVQAASLCCHACACRAG